jgi:protein phosphatase
LLCSDGLFVAVDEAGMALALAEETDLEALCARLIAAANGAGGPDNITVLVLSVDVA